MIRYEVQVIPAKNDITGEWVCVWEGGRMEGKDCYDKPTTIEKLIVWTSETITLSPRQ